MKSLRRVRRCEATMLAMSASPATAGRKVPTWLGSFVLLLVSLAASCETGAFVLAATRWGRLETGISAGRRTAGRVGLLSVRPGAPGTLNRNYRQEGRCFSVALHSNSHGARDRERLSTTIRRTVVLGDSFAEGWGSRRGNG